MTGPGADPATLTALFEGAPRFLARLDAAGPFADDAELFARARAIAHAMPEAEQIELIDAHPRLGAPPGSVSAMSYREQGYDRGAGTPVDVAAELERLNDDVRGRPRVPLLRLRRGSFARGAAPRVHRRARSGP